MKLKEVIVTIYSITSRSVKIFLQENKVFQFIVKEVILYDVFFLKI